MFISAGLCVLGKDILKLLRYESPFIVIRARVAAMLVLMDTGDVDSAKGVGQKISRRKSGIAEIEMDDKEGDE